MEVPTIKEEVTAVECLIDNEPSSALKKEEPCSVETPVVKEEPCSKRSLEEGSRETESVEAKKMKLDDDVVPDGDPKNGERGEVEIKNNQTENHINESATNDSRCRDDSYTTENFKIEIFELPKHTGYGQLKKFLKKLGLDPRKLKMPPGGVMGALVTFPDEESRQKALDVLNDNCKLKGRVLRATKSKAHVDPYEKAQAQAKVSEPSSLEELKAKLMQAVSPMQHVSYEEQLADKEQKMTSFVKNEMENSILKVNEDIANVIHAQRLKNLNTLQTGPRCEIQPIIASPVIVGYRNKNEFTIGVGPEKSGKELTVGFRVGSYSEGTLIVLEPSDCKAVDSVTLTVAERFQEFFRQSGYKAYDNYEHKGHWRFLMVRTTQQNHLMIVVSMHVRDMKEEEVVQVKADIASFCSSDPALAGLGVGSLYFSRVGTSNRESDQKFELLAGEETIEEKLNEMKFRISPDAFFQANTKGAELLISTIGSWLLEDGQQTAVQVPLVDVCCGTGTIGLALSNRFSKVFGIECVEKAIEDAKKNASLNEVDNVEFICGKAEDVLPDILDRKLGGVDSLVAVVDPPRAGLHKRVLQAIRKCDAIKRFIYVSCNPKLAKNDFCDLARPPTNKGFKGDPFLPKKAVPIDLFPQTHHCELVILFERVTEEEISEANLFMKSRDVSNPAPSTPAVPN